MDNQTPTTEKKETLEKKIFCEQCINFVIEKVHVDLHSYGFFGSDKIISERDSTSLYCKEKIDGPINPDSVSINYKEGNKNNDCKYFSEGKPEVILIKKKEEVNLDAFQ